MFSFCDSRGHLQKMFLEFLFLVPLLATLLGGFVRVPYLQLYIFENLRVTHNISAVHVTYIAVDFFVLTWFVTYVVVHYRAVQVQQKTTEALISTTHAFDEEVTKFRDYKNVILLHERQGGLSSGLVA